MMFIYVIAVYVSSDPGTYIDRIRFAFQNRVWQKHTQESQQSHAHKSRREHTNTAQGVYNSRSAQISNTMIWLRGCGV